MTDKPNSIRISMIQTGCCSAEFDRTYPIELNGIINQHEYQQSIENINNCIRKSTGTIYVIIIYLLVILACTLCFILGGLQSNNYQSHSSNIPPLISFGIGMTICGTLVFVVLIIWTKTRQLSRLRRVIAEESAKYSSKSLTPCSWKLEVVTYYVTRCENRNSYTSYYILIDINQPDPPAYSSISLGFSSQSGQTFDKY